MGNARKAPNLQKKLYFSLKKKTRSIDIGSIIKNMFKVEDID